MLKRILVECKPNFIRAAVMHDFNLVKLDLEYSFSKNNKTNIYRSKIKNIEIGLNAFFIDYGDIKDGFLPFKNIAPQYYPDSNCPSKSIKIGQQIIVQMCRDIKGKKCASFTTMIDIAGSYLVVQFMSKRTEHGVSSSILEPVRSKIKNILKQLDVPKGISVIARTSCQFCNIDQIKSDLSTILQIWETICKENINCIGLLYSCNDILTRLTRDVISSDYKEIIVNSIEVKHKLTNLLKTFNKNNNLCLSNTKDIFDKYNIQSQYEQAFLPTVHLKSGGSIIIIENEAMTCIDVNSSRYTKGVNISETAFFINKEAATEIAKQLKIRNISGLIAIDFIEMYDSQNILQLEEYLAHEFEKDQGIIQIVRMSPLGIIEISRQYTAPSLQERLTSVCSRCEGIGVEKSLVYFKYIITSKIQEFIKQNKPEKIYVYISFEYEKLLLDYEIQELSNINQVSIEIIPRKDIYGQKVFINSQKNEHPVIKIRKFSHKIKNASVQVISKENPITYFFKSIFSFFKSFIKTDNDNSIKVNKKVKLFKKSTCLYIRDKNKDIENS